RAVAELSLDQVTIKTAHKPVTAYELEAELLPDGKASDLHDLVQLFTQEYSLAPQPLTKFERAMRMAEDGQGQNGKPRSPRARKAQSTPANGSGESAADGVTEPLLESGLPKSSTEVEGAGDAGAPSADEKVPARKSGMGLAHTDSIDTA